MNTHVQLILEGEIEPDEGPAILALAPMRSPQDRADTLRGSLAENPSLLASYAQVHPQGADPARPRPFWP